MLVWRAAKAGLETWEMGWTSKVKICRDAAKISTIPAGITLCGWFVSEPGILDGYSAAFEKQPASHGLAGRAGALEYRSIRLVLGTGPLSRRIRAGVRRPKAPARAMIRRYVHSLTTAS